MLRGRDRDADPAGHRVDANSALADAVALNSASAAASTRPSLWAGPVSCTPTGRPSSSKPTGHGRRRQAREVLRHGVGHDRVAEALGADAAQLRRERVDRRQQQVGGGEQAREARADALAGGDRLGVLLERDRRARARSRAATSSLYSSRREGNVVGVGERGLDRLDRHERRVDPLGLLERRPRRRRRSPAAWSNARWMPGVSGCRCRSGQIAIARSRARRARGRRSAPRRTGGRPAGVRAIGPAWSSERASGKTPVAGIRL